MRILIDTQALLWYLEGNAELSRGKRDTILNPANEAFVSVASLWEIAIKISAGKLKLKGSMTELLDQLAAQSIEILTIAPGHVLQMASLPPLQHADPCDRFDRMIAAQSKVEFLTIVTTDTRLADYGVKIV
ncbi:MAG: type II toxin-antitoxin system VapC family toxin [Acidobacteria bacterium]|nr:type II toxin-antitoxin system VapC family toxin [Acidobacteriota bacterium]